MLGGGSDFQTQPPFPYVVAVMTSNNASVSSRVFNPIKHSALPRPRQRLRPLLPKLMAPRGWQFTAEFLVPGTVLLVADGLHGGGSSPGLHGATNILSNLPMGVLRNVFFIFAVLSIRPLRRYATDLRCWRSDVVAVVIMGNLLPERLFLAPLYYMLATSSASLADAEETSVVKSSALVVNQLAVSRRATAEIMTDKVAAFRAMHTTRQGAQRPAAAPALDDEALTTYP